MNRRSVLTFIGGVALGALSGCLGEESPSGDDPEDGDGIEYTVSSTATIDGNTTPLSYDFAQHGETVTETDAVEFVLSVTNKESHPMEILSGAPPPFGLFALASGNESERSVYPWTDEYRKSDHVDTSGQDVVGLEDAGVRIEIEPEETIERTFTLSAETPRLAPGEYTFDQRCSVGDARDESTDTHVVIEGTVEIDSRATSS